MSDKHYSWDDGPAPGRISGFDAQTLELRLGAGDRVMCDGRAFLAAAGHFPGFDVAWGDRLLEPMWRRLAGENPIMASITPKAPTTVVLASPTPSRIIRVPLRKGDSFFAARGTFLASTGNMTMSVGFTRRIRAGLFGGQGFVFARYTGEGDLFLRATGRALRWNLGEKVEIQTSPRNLVGFDATIGYDIQTAGNVWALLFGNQGFLINQLTGPGRVIVQSADIAGTPGQPTTPTPTPKQVQRTTSTPSKGQA
jgi:uncharacterized protein (AIM24 family)